MELLPGPLRLIFVPELRQLYLLYSIYTKTLTDYIAAQVGVEGVQNILKFVNGHTTFPGINFVDDASREIQYQQLPDVLIEKLTAIFLTMHTALYNHISSSFGSSTAHTLTQKSYQHVKELYGSDFAIKFLEIIPEGILDKNQEKQALQQSSIKLTP